MSWTPTADRIHVQRLEGHGLETVSAGGIIIPATVGKSVQNKPDYFRARVLSMGPEAERVLGAELKPGDEVLVYTYHGTAEQTFVGEKDGRDRLFVRPDDILCAVGP